MKNTFAVSFLVPVLISVLFLSACQKDVQSGADGKSVGTLKTGSNGGCTPVIYNGIYRVDSVLTNTNYVDVQVDVAVEGSFDVKSDTVNGFSFRKTGLVGTGLNVIRLYASGKPVAAGVYTFTIKYGLTVCSFDITVFGNGLGSALFTLGGSPGNCSANAPNGNYVVGQAMSPANTVQMTVNVIAAGSYTVNSPVLNGVSFAASGVFTNPGIQTILLAATGTGLAPGLFNFPVTNGVTTCTVPITFLPFTTNAAFALSGSPNNCTGAVVNGSYVAGTALTALNVAVINVNVTSPGLYTISTGSVNGISFSASGTFTVTGQQQVVLIGSGTPAAAGTFSLPVTGGGRTCSISVTCSGLANIDYIPQTSYSHWSWKQVGGLPDDTSYIHVLPTPITIGPNSYRIFETVNSINYPGVRLDSFYYRKNGAQYFYIFNDSYGFDNGFNTEGILLDSSLSTNAFWIINLGTDTWGGLPATGSIKAKILAKGATETVGGFSFSNIIKVEYVFRYNTGSGDVDYERWESWYARGIGNIYNSYSQIPVTTVSEEMITGYQVF